MGKLIGLGNTDNFGEKLFIDKVQEYLDDTNIIYWNRQVFGREFDVCILMPGKGILDNTRRCSISGLLLLPQNIQAAFYNIVSSLVDGVYVSEKFLREKFVQYGR